MELDVVLNPRARSFLLCCSAGLRLTSACQPIGSAYVADVNSRDSVVGEKCSPSFSMKANDAKIEHPSVGIFQTLGSLFQVYRLGSSLLDLFKYNVSTWRQFSHSWECTLRK